MIVPILQGQTLTMMVDAYNDRQFAKKIKHPLSRSFKYMLS